MEIGKRKPSLYIDTNVIQDTFRNRRSKSTYLLERISDKRIKAATSSFTLLELMDIETEHTQVWRRIRQGWSFDDMLRKRYPTTLSPAELDESYREVYDKFYDYYVKTEVIRLFALDTAGWDFAFELMGDYNLSKGDAIHVATAKFAECNAYVTNDSDLLEILNPHRKDESLKWLGIAAIPAELRKALEGVGIDAASL